jgi:NADPH2:quinone reductase
MEYVEVATPTPGNGEALVRIEVVGVNYIDIYHRNGLYPLPTPYTPGSEAAGVVEQVGPGVTEVQRGDRVVYSHIGSYGDHAIVPAAKLIKLPDGIDARTAAAALLQGLTAQYLTTSTFPLKGGEQLLVHAAAGGMGGLLVQVAKLRGAFVFGTASTAKLDFVRGAGADVVIDYTKSDFEAEVLRQTEGRGLDVVYDSVGRATFDSSLNCLKLRGMLVMCGQSSGPVPPFDILRLAKKCAFLTRPNVAGHTSRRDELLGRAADVFDWIASGKVRLHIDREIPLAQAAEAHRLLENRQTIGKLLLIP